MSEYRAPSLVDFARWIAEMGRLPVNATPSERLREVARRARDASLRQAMSRAGRLEVLTLLAAASQGSGVPPEMTTPRGFRVSIVYGEGPTGGASLCVLVQCPPGLAPQLVGRTAFLWNGDRRFELGQFDPDGRAIGTLPAGIEITASDFERGAVQFEDPESPRNEP